MEMEDVLGKINTDNSNAHGSALHQSPSHIYEIEWVESIPLLTMSLRRSSMRA
jgi:hypothetical protein